MGTLHVRIVHPAAESFGYFVETRDGELDTWWPRVYCLTLWGARRARRRLLAAGSALIVVSDDTDAVSQRPQVA